MQIGKIESINPQTIVGSVISFPNGCDLPYTFQLITKPQGKFGFKVYDVEGNEIDYHNLDFFYDEKGVTIRAIKEVKENEGQNVINAAIAFIDQLNSFNNFWHPEVLKRTKELRDAVAYFQQKDCWEDEREKAFVALNANEFAEWFKTHPDPAEAQTFKENTFTSFHRCEWCGDEIVKIPVTIQNYKEFSVVCAKCLQWGRKEGKVVITELKNIECDHTSVRLEQPIIITNATLKERSETP